MRGSHQMISSTGDFAVIVCIRLDRKAEDPSDILKECKFWARFITTALRPGTKASVLFVGTFADTPEAEGSLIQRDRRIL